MKYTNHSTKTRHSLRGIVTKARVLVKNGKRDANHLANYGITAEFLTDIEAKVAILENSDRHELVLTQISEITHQRNLEITKLKYMLRTLLAQMELVYETTDIKKPGFITNAISTMKANKIIEFAKNISVELSDRFEMYLAVGITPERKAELDTLLDKIIDLHETKDFEYTQLDNKTSQRNELRADVERAIKHLSRIGKAHWGLQNKAFFKDYVITPKGTTTTQETAESQTPALPDPDTDS